MGWCLGEPVVMEQLVGWDPMRYDILLPLQDFLDVRSLGACMGEALINERQGVQGTFRGPRTDQLPRASSATEVESMPPESWAEVRPRSRSRTAVRRASTYCPVTSSNRSVPGSWIRSNQFQ